MTTKKTKETIQTPARLSNHEESENAINLRRVKIVRISPTVFEHILATGYKGDFEVVEGLPPNAKMTGIRYEPVAGEVHMLFQSDDFEETVEGSVPPLLNPVLQPLAEA